MQEEINLNAPDNTKYIVVGNKKDLEDERKIQKEEGENLAKNNNAHFYETNVKDGTNFYI